MNQQNRFWLVGITFSLLLGVILATSGFADARNDDNPSSPSQNLQSLINGAYEGFLSEPQSGDALDIAQKFIKDNASTLGLTTTDVSDMALTDRYISDDTGVTHLYLTQRYEGIDVFNGMISISLMPDGRVLFIGNRFVDHLLEQVKGNNIPSLTAVEAVRAAAEHLQLPIVVPLNTLAIIGGPAQETLFSKGGISQNDIPVKLVFDSSNAIVRLAWNVIIYQNDSLHWWNIRVDANTGEILSQNDWVINEDFDIATYSSTDITSNTTDIYPTSIPPTPAGDSSGYKVFAIPVESPNHAVATPPADGRIAVYQPADIVSNPFGWHDTNNLLGPEFLTTRGNNVYAYTDIDANNIPDVGSSPNGGSSLQFFFSLNLAQDPNTYRPAAVVNLFYWNNIIHDINYRYGFNEVAGNFQAHNHGRGGIGNDYLLAEAQDGSGTNNANLSIPPDGLSPRMQMFLWTQPTPNKDGDLDNGIIIHEYGHGISQRLTGGPSNVNCLLNNEQMGEGWSDWQSLILTMRTGQTGTTNRGVGTYVLNQPVNGVGIRPAPYTTDMAVNAFTYSNLPQMSIPHGVGFIWNTMLWEMNWGLINEYGFNQNIKRQMGGPWNTLSGNQLAHQLVMNGLKLQPCSPGFVDGRNAILAADQALTGGKNKCIIWRAFAKRGLGYSANQGSSNSITDGTTAFDLPSACQLPLPCHDGLTWVLREQIGTISHVGYDSVSNPYQGDTSCTTTLPILCIYQDGSPIPPNINPDFYHGWTYGHIALSSPIVGSSLTSLSAANAVCQQAFGIDWRMAEFHDGGGGWTYYSYGGNIPSNIRFWLYINDQLANPWN